MSTVQPIASGVFKWVLELLFWHALSSFITDQSWFEYHSFVLSIVADRVHPFMGTIYGSSLVMAVSSVMMHRDTK